MSGTTRQLDALRRRHPHVELTIEVDRVLGDRRDSHLSALIDAALAALLHGNVVISTSRHVVTGQGARDSLAIARAVSAAIVELVDRVVAACVPRFVLAKGGIMSSDVAIHAFEDRARDRPRTAAARNRLPVGARERPRPRRSLHRLRRQCRRARVPCRCHREGSLRELCSAPS
ncbi:nucleotide-binding domain containing protein [Paenarthrobacter nitroguajacolicus]|uniref:nucleotide-binding domain containing protein n=1 Tax=Paenarthrobacter nitroguajacolicus TaxID=211146 RepID=UPI0037CAD9D1